MTEEKIARINALAKKSKTTGLTEAEKAEQQALRKEYIEDMKSSLRAQLEHTSIKEPDGTIKPIPGRLVYRGIDIDTLVEESPFCLGRHTVGGKDYLLMKPIHADFALLGAYKCDEYGNCWYKGTMRNFNVVMATAADTVIAECEYIVPVGEIEPENIHTYGMCVDYIVEGDRK